LIAALKNDNMRTYLYLLAGLTSARIGRNLGQIFLTDLGWLTGAPEIVLFPCIAISLAIGSVANEIFLSNPTRPKLSLRILRIPLMIALAIGLLAGLSAGIISQILFAPMLRIPTPIVRIFGWLIVGAAVGLAEGLSWRWHSLEAGNPQRFRQRLILSIAATAIASLAAALSFELIRLIGNFPSGLQNYEDPLGFTILGLCLGAAFRITNSSPSYLPALRAGAGFEYRGEEYEPIDHQLTPNRTLKLDNSDTLPCIDRGVLKFVSYRSKGDDDEDTIEEGLSIELPVDRTIQIGSAAEAHLRLPHLPTHAADLKLNGKIATLIPDAKFYRTLAINGTVLGSRRNVTLKHNYVLSFYTIDENELETPKYYRLVFYNRFLDPLA
jgi:hypothetical protein